MERRHLACLGAAALLLVCWIVQAVLFAGSDPDMLALALEEAAASVEPEEPAPPLRLAVFATAGEESGNVERALRARFENRPGWKLLDRDFMEEAIGDYGAEASRRPRDAKEAAVSGRKLGVEAAFWADVKAYRRTEADARVEFAWGLVRVPSGDAVVSGIASVSKTRGFFTADRYRARVDGTSPLFRVFLWLLTVLVLPAALLPVNELLLGLRNNAASAGLLAGYAATDFVAMLLLNGFRLVSVFWGISALVALAAAALYSLAVLNAMAEE
jgi:hypothetical protein